MNHPIIQRLILAKKELAIIFGGIALLNYSHQAYLQRYFFGVDGNGGDMLKIHTYLTDQEMASLRFQKRVSWHGFKQRKDSFKAISTHINEEELQDLGVKFPEDRYVEYNKRPPHDFYL